MDGNGKINKEEFEELLTELNDKLNRLGEYTCIDIYEIGDYVLAFNNKRLVGRNMRVYSRKDEVFYNTVKEVGSEHGNINWLIDVLSSGNENIPDINELDKEAFKVNDSLNLNKINIYLANNGLLLYYNLVETNRGERFVELIQSLNLSKEETKQLIKPYLKFYKGDKQVLIDRLNKCDKYFK